MPLRDHFRPPLSERRPWESFHATWAGSLADVLNQRWLPEGYFAEVQTYANARVEIDVATYQETAAAGSALPNGPGRVALAAPTLVIHACRTPKSGPSTNCTAP